MTKRRAEGSSLHEAPSSPHPQKKKCRSVCDAEPELVAVHAPHAAAAAATPPALFTTLIGERRRKRPRCCEDHEQPGGTEAPGQRPSIATERVDACFSGKFRRAGGACRCTCEMSVEDRASGSNLDERTKVTRPCGDSEGELCAFNSFQFWRTPLPALDLMLLDTRPTAEPMAEPTRSRKDATEEMET